VREGGSGRRGCGFVPCEDRCDGGFGLADDGERCSSLGFGGVSEDHLAQVGAAVLNLRPVALHDGLQHSHDRVQDVLVVLGGGNALLEGASVVGVLHEEQ
jgi:hypothetical protein